MERVTNSSIYLMIATLTSLNHPMPKEDLGYSYLDNQIHYVHEYQEP